MKMTLARLELDDESDSVIDALQRDLEGDVPVVFPPTRDAEFEAQIEGRVAVCVELSHVHQIHSVVTVLLFWRWRRRRCSVDTRCEDEEVFPHGVFTMWASSDEPSPTPSLSGVGRRSAKALGVGRRKASSSG